MVIIHLRSKKSDIDAKSTIELEHCAMAPKACELMQIKHLLKELGVNIKNPSVAYQKNIYFKTLWQCNVISCNLYCW